MPSDGDVGDDSYNIEEADDIHEWGVVENHVGDDSDAGESDEDEDGAVKFPATEADEMGELGEEEENDAEDEGVVDGEDDVGDAGDNEGELEEVVFGEHPESVEDTEKNAGEFNESDDLAGGGDDAESEDGDIGAEPKHWPGRFAQAFW